jgi:hypothetical protein
MKLELTDDTVTFAITTARSTPLCWREKDQRQIDGLQEKVNHPNEWCHTLVPVPKRSTDGSVTGCILTVDLTKLDKCVNKCVNRSCSRDNLVICGHRLVVPKDLRQRLHASHQGEVRTKRRARQLVHWPGVDQDVSNAVMTCKHCQTQQKEPIIQERTPYRVFEVASADFFSVRRAHLPRLRGSSLQVAVLERHVSRSQLCTCRV